MELSATDARSSTVHAITSAFEAAGVFFIRESDGSPGLVKRG